MAKNLAAPGITPPHYEREPLVIEGRFAFEHLDASRETQVTIGGATLEEHLADYGVGSLGWYGILLKAEDYGNVKITIELEEDEN